MKRSVIVGDVHGCSQELEALLDRVGFGSGDELVLVGDLVAKGPDSAGVLGLVRRLGARAVLGNHDQRALEALAERGGGTGSGARSTSLRLLEELSAADWDYLRGLPLSLSLPDHGALVVHAGLVPGVTLEAQEPFFLTHLRSVLEDGRPSDRRQGIPWAELYLGPPHVVFGHDAIGGLQLRPWATGLDTGCVYGRELTALVLAEGQPVPPPEQRRRCLVQVPARRAYVVPARLA